MLSAKTPPEEHLRQVICKVALLHDKVTEWTQQYHTNTNDGQQVMTNNNINNKRQN